MRASCGITVVLAVSIAGAAGGALAQAKGGAGYPGKPVRFIVPFPPGGSTDVVARIIHQRLGERLGTQVIIDNRPGANTIVGTELAAKAPADGYTILMATSGHGVNPSVYRKLPFDSVRDFTPVVHVTDSSNLIASHPSLPAKDIRDLVALARARPGQVTYSSAGIGSVQHLTIELIRQIAKLDVTHVAYKGGAASVLAAMTGEVTMVITGAPALVQHVKGGKLKALGITSRARSPLLPEVRTVAEAGFPGFESYYWLGVMGPAGLPAPIVERLNAEVNAVLKEPAIREQLLAQIADPVGGTARDLETLLKNEIERWAKVVRAGGIQLD